MLLVGAVVALVLLVDVALVFLVVGLVVALDLVEEGVVVLVVGEVALLEYALRADAVAVLFGVFTLAKLPVETYPGGQ